MKRKEVKTMNIQSTIRKTTIATGVVTILSVAFLLTGGSAAYASESSDSHHNSYHDYSKHHDHNSRYDWGRRGYKNMNNGYGYNGGIQFMMMPSVDYLKNAFMQSFNYQNDINYANHTDISYNSSQANENFRQGNQYGHNDGNSYNNFGGYGGGDSLL